MKRGDRLRRSVLALFTAVAVASGLVAVGMTEAEAAPDSYSQVVDNRTEDRFKADDDWGESSYGRGVQDDNYRFARPAEDAEPAQFKVDIPETANYAVYVRWPQVKGPNASVPVGVVTTSGVEWTRVNQQRRGGGWVPLGVYEMQAGDDYSVMLSRDTKGEDYVIADAVKVEYDSPSEPAESDEDSSSNGRTGEDVVKEARKWMGVRYRHGGQTRRGVDCSGLTMMVYKRFGVSLQHWDDKQYRTGVRVSGRPEPGDLVFFNEHGRGISHVGIYAGDGKLIHASDYFNKVTESDMKFIKGYVGAKRMLINGRPIKQSTDKQTDEDRDDGEAFSEEEAAPSLVESPTSSTDKVSLPPARSVSRKPANAHRVQAKEGDNSPTQTKKVSKPQSNQVKEQAPPPNDAKEQVPTLNDAKKQVPAVNVGPAGVDKPKHKERRPRQGK